MKTRTIVRNAVAVAAAAGATVAVSAVAASASTSASTFHGHHSLTPMTGPLSHEAEIATLTHWWRTAPYALTDAGRMPVVVRLPAGSPTPGQWYARDQRFTELHNSAVTELAFAERSHGGYEVLTQQGGRLVFEPLNRHGAGWAEGMLIRFFCVRLSQLRVVPGLEGKAPGGRKEDWSWPPDTRLTKPISGGESASWLRRSAPWTSRA